MSNPIRGWTVVGGIVLGLLATFVWMTVVFVIALSQENQTGGAHDWLVFALFVVPLPIAVAMLCWRRTRQAGAGFVMGLAIGTLVLAGICSSLVVPGITA